MTNRDPILRHFSASQLAWVTDDIDVFFAHLKPRLHDPDASVRFAVVESIGVQTDSPDEAIPLLISALADTEDSVASHAAKFLADFGTNGLRAFGALSNLVESGRPIVASRALRSLVAIAPTEALPMTLQMLRSSSVDWRARAAGVLGEYEVVTPEIAAALEQASLDSDAKVVRIARRSLAKLRAKTTPISNARPASKVTDAPSAITRKESTTWK